MIDGVDNMFDWLSERTALMIAPKIALELRIASPARPPLIPASWPAAASIRSEPVPLVVVVVDPVPVVTVVVVPPSSRAAIAPAIVPILGMMLE